MFIKNAFVILKVVVLILLLFIYYFYFFLDVIKNYNKGLTNMATKQEKLESNLGIEAPSISICLSPTSKLEKVQEMNLTGSFFFLQSGSYEHLDNNLIMKDIMDQTSFKLGEDFDIEFGEFWVSNSSVSMKSLKLGKQPFLGANGGSFIDVKEYFTMFSGKCYVLTSDIYVSAGVPLILSIVNNDKRHLDHVKLSIISKNDYLGNVNGVWNSLNPLEVRADFDTGGTSIDLKESKTNLISECDQDSFFYCNSQTVMQFKKSNADQCGKCLPVLTHAYFDILNETLLPFCDNLKDEKCNIDLLTVGVNQALTECKIQCKITEYTAKTSKITWEVNQHGNRSADVWIFHSSASRTITEEYLIYDEIGMIGNVGGSLGLFLGFSFFGAFSDCLDFLRNRNLCK